jgi:hypothetical protein
MDWKAELDALIKAVEANKTIKASVALLLGGLSTIAGKIADDATASKAFFDSLKAKAAVVADAVIANTPKTTK